jgi:hypothetical protein
VVDRSEAPTEGFVDLNQHFSRGDNVADPAPASLWILVEPSDLVDLLLRSALDNLEG